ncbi:MAG: hypothetical protein ACOH2I_02940 [Pseudomonas sp.]
MRAGVDLTPAGHSMAAGKTWAGETFSAVGAEVKAPVTTTAAALKRLRIVFIARLPRLRDLPINYSLIAVDLFKKAGSVPSFKVKKMLSNQLPI